MEVEYQRVKDQLMVVRGEYPPEQRENIMELIEYEEERIKIEIRKGKTEEEALLRITERYAHERNPENHGLCVVLKNGEVIAQNMLGGLNGLLKEDQEHPDDVYLAHRLGEALDFSLIGWVREA